MASEEGAEKGTNEHGGLRGHKEMETKTLVFFFFCGCCEKI